ncbi:hypothetical protein [Actinacidiphila paucisporea]|uniref:Uncharacterized protein n=1 Tax=Actinacidiphila paucisporea TaxID=310782 RepID=A0A1M7I806_9ACTN|nr:hypothetical protein [Actinacidiphila paucisporea]SHM36946.1 hypothetical protein SAMN05216499_110178 [Actinacidiphila paucisporea]
MNGYAVVYEPAKQRTESFGGVGSAEGIGPVHAAPAEGDHGLPGPVTLCGLETDDLVKHPQDQPLDPFETWYPPVGVNSFCRECDEAIAAA